MRTVGQLLQDERQKKGFTIEQVEKATKIRRKFLEALETDDYKKMPALPYVHGFLKNYSDFLGLRSHTMIALFRRQFKNQEKSRSEVVEQPLTNSGWQLTPNKVIFSVVMVLLIGLIGYFFVQFQALHKPPPLLVENPLEESIIKEETVPVFGDTDPDATLTINNEPILIKEDGEFYKDIPLTVGGNTLIIEATNRSGEKVTITRRVTRTP